MQLPEQNKAADKNGTIDEEMNQKNSSSAKSSKVDKLKLDVKSFYSNHFPTDRKTYEWRLPFVGLIGSMLAVNYVVFVLSFRDVEQFAISQLCYIFVAGVLGYQLYYGLNIGDRKQFTPWIIHKLIEILIVTGFAIAFVAINGSWGLGEFFSGLIVAGINCIPTCIVISTSRKQQHGNQQKPDPDRDIYNIYDNV